MSLIIAAPRSGSGKTTVTLGLLRALSRKGFAVRAAKSGPDYIDPRFHAAACGVECLNLDAWAMSPDRIKAFATGPTPLIVEGAMGLFDGAAPYGKGATADLARILSLPTILVVDAAKMAHSVAPLVKGFATHDAKVPIKGVLLNNIGSPKHEAMLRDALGRAGIPVFGALPRTPDLAHPSRHLGLVQADERPDLDAFLEKAADLIDAHIDMAKIKAMLFQMPDAPYSAPKPPAQSIAMAQDQAFAFSYPHLIRDWHAAGATLSFFSPLNNDAAPDADLIYLPGGYPELHAGKLASNMAFLDSLRTTKADIYGECGGYMTLGDVLIDANGTPHKMAGLLNLETSFAQRKLHLGYRALSANQGPFKGRWNGHEFHYASTISAKGTPLFQAQDAAGDALTDMGLIQKTVSGSFAHIIDRAPLPNP